MARDGSVTFGDLVGKLDTLRVTCNKCGRGGRYSVRRLALEHGRDGRLTDWLAELTKDCPWRQAPELFDPCGAQMPDLLKLARPW
jgi:hypothetical protein